jgi:uncharacterized protein involved in exopolysaccharide biosynthesis
MPEPFSAPALLRHLLSRKGVIASAVLAAAGVSFLGTLLLTKQYTAEVRLLIEPPGGTDPRSALVISPMYLDSLKTFVLMASSSELFAQAMDELELREPSDRTSLAALQASTLDVEMIPSTRVLSIRATLPNPAKAHALAAWMAEAVVRRNEQIQSASATARAEAATKARDATAREVREAEESLLTAARQNPTGGLEAEVEALVSNRTSLREELRFLELRLSEMAAGSISGPAAPEGAVRLGRRAEQLRSSVAELDQKIEEREARAARAAAEQMSLEVRLKAAQEVLTGAQNRLLAETSMGAASGERLHIIDRGSTPERPSSPNVAVHVIAASVLALVGCVFILFVQFGLSKEDREPS